MAAENSILLEVGPFLAHGPENVPFAVKTGFRSGIRLAPSPWLAPLAPLYWLGSRLHRQWMKMKMRMRTFRQPFAPEIPLVVIGALRAGGSGKTSVTLELARRLESRGLAVAILAYRLAPRPRGKDLLEVRPEDDWRESSDEALMLRRQSGARVFVTRHRARAWRALHDERLHGGARFDIILSDDGFQDPRLDGPRLGVGALRILLERPGDGPGLWDLLPAGPFRETRGAAARADLIAVEIPSCDGPASGPGPAAAEGGAMFFRCRAVLPPGLDRARPWIVVCGLGDNARFVAELRGEGLEIAEVLEAADHAAVAPERLRECARRHPRAGFLCARKDAVKMAGLGGLAVVEREVELDPRLVEAVEAHRLARKQIGTLPTCF
jgi:tetraacyldisaccharide 4'-kinase